jgi:hypothetical protein
MKKIFVLLLCFFATKIRCAENKEEMKAQLTANRKAVTDLIKSKFPQCENHIDNKFFACLLTKSGLTQEKQEIIDRACATIITDFQECIAENQKIKKIKEHLLTRHES